MKSTGNDIVALGQVNKQRATETRFYSKILSTSEQELYKNLPAGLPFEHYVWLLWSVKESAYKYLKRNAPDLEFSPTRIVISNLEFPLAPKALPEQAGDWEYTGNKDEYYSGTVTHGEHVICFRAMVTDDWITSVVNSNATFQNVYWGIKRIGQSGYEQQFNGVRALLLNKLGAFIPGDMQVTKSPAGYPVILRDGQDMHITASLAHDGYFVAYAFIL